jgi:pyruvate/2-oxoglutarate dehydrogenase complex dihydrolipoamide acyltransferase (E2) component
VIVNCFDSSSCLFSDKEEASKLLNRAYDRRNVADAAARELVRELDEIAASTGTPSKKVDEDVDCRLRLHAVRLQSEAENVARTVQAHQRKFSAPSGASGVGVGEDGNGAPMSGGRKRSNCRATAGGKEAAAVGESYECHMEFEAAVLAQVLATFFAYCTQCTL